MKTTVGVFFGGRSTEHEISVISALQAINAFNKEKYEIATWLPCKTCAPRFT